MNGELIQKAKTAKSAEELLALARAQGIDMTAERAGELFAKLNPACGELADDELDNVAGGGCSNSGGDAPSGYSGYANGHQLGTSCPVCHNDCWKCTGWVSMNAPRSWECAVCYLKYMYGAPDAPASITGIQYPGREENYPQSSVWVEF